MFQRTKSQNEFTKLEKKFKLLSAPQNEVDFSSEFVSLKVNLCEPTGKIDLRVHQRVTSCFEE